MSNRNVLVLTYWSFNDALIQTYTLPYVKMIRKNLREHDKLYLFTFEQERYKLSKEGKLKAKKDLKNDGIYWINIKYSRWGFTGFIKLLTLIPGLFCFSIVKNISVFHAWCTPAGAIGYLLSILTFRKLLIDSFEPHAEAMVENGEWKKNSKAFKVLHKFEKLQAHRAQALIATTEGMRTYSSEKLGVKKDIFFAKPACVDLNMFDPSNYDRNKLKEEFGINESILCIYSGKLGGIYYDKEVFLFAKQCHKKWGEDFCFLILSATPKSVITSYCEDLKLPASVCKVLFVNHCDVPQYMSLADFAINPVKPVPSKRYCTSIKDGEYWAMGLPVVIPPNISDDSSIIEMHNIGAVVDFTKEESILEGIQKIDLLLGGNRIDLRNKIRKVASHYRSFDIAEKIYSQIY